jgi:hypothetical protein
MTMPSEHDLERALASLREPTVARPEPSVSAMAAAGRRRRRSQVALSSAAAVLAVLIGVGAVAAVVGRTDDGTGGVRTEGSSAVYGAEGPANPDQLDRAATIIEKRLVHDGFRDAEVTVEDGAVVVSGSAARQPETLVAVSRTTTLVFRPVLGTDVAAVRPADGRDQLVGSGVDEQTTFHLGPGIDRNIIESATAIEAVSGQWSVNPLLRPGADGIDPFNELVRHCYARDDVCPTGRLAIVVGDRVLSAPAINEASFERDRIEISGGFDQAGAENLADLLNLGDLPVSLRLR